jgi:hypothetical protein
VLCRTCSPPTRFDVTPSGPVRGLIEGPKFRLSGGVFTHGRQKIRLCGASATLPGAQHGHYAPSAYATVRNRSGYSGQYTACISNQSWCIRISDGTGERPAKDRRPAFRPWKHDRNVPAIRGAVPKGAPSFEAPTRRPGEVIEHDASPNTGARYSMQRHWSGWRGTLGKSSPRWIVGCWPATERLITSTSWSSTRRSYRFGAGQRFQGHVKSDASQETARHRLSLSRRCFVVAGLFRCVGWRRSAGDHQAVCRATEAARALLALKRDASTR